MPAFRITLAYEGTDFIGWQRQAAGASIQGALEDALREFGDGGVAVAGAGRTDAGVHALGQVASFALTRAVAPETIVRALNAKLPETIRVNSAASVADSFHARFDARAKTYRYRIWNGDVLPPFERRYAWHVPGDFDVDAMQHAASLLEGEHDFAAFQSAGTDVATTVRTVSRSEILVVRNAECGVRNGMLLYEVTADGFLRHMVRAIVGSLVDVGRRRQPSEWITRLLAGGDRSAAGRTAPAHGLFLVSVDYPEASGAAPDALAAEP